MSEVDYLTDGGSGATPATSAGDNPSTWAGIFALIALSVLLVMRRSFRRFM